jgi:hypothetical protein
MATGYLHVRYVVDGIITANEDCIIPYIASSDTVTDIKLRCLEQLTHLSSLHARFMQHDHQLYVDGHRSSKLCRGRASISMSPESSLAKSFGVGNGQTVTLCLY